MKIIDNSQEPIKYRPIPSLPEYTNHPIDTLISWVLEIGKIDVDKLYKDLGFSNHLGEYTNTLKHNLVSVIE